MLPPTTAHGRHRQLTLRRLRILRIRWNIAADATDPTVPFNVHSSTHKTSASSDPKLIGGRMYDWITGDCQQGELFTNLLLKMTITIIKRLICILEQ